MARVEALANGFCILAVSPGECALLEHGTKQGGQIILDDAIYFVSGDKVLLPAGISLQSAQWRCRLFERSARLHQQALEQRNRFHLLKQQ